MVSLYTTTNREGSKSAEGEAEPERAEDGNGTATTVSSALLIRPSGQEKVDVHIIRSRRLLGKNRWEEGLGSLAGSVGCDRRSRLLFNSGVRRCWRPSRSWHQMAPRTMTCITHYASSITHPLLSLVIGIHSKETRWPCTDPCVHLGN